MKRRHLLLLWLPVVAIGCEDPTRNPPPIPEGAVAAGTRLGEARVTGRVTFAGEAPPVEAIDMRSDAGCRQHGQDDPRKENLLVGPDGAVHNVFVYLSSGMDTVFAPPDADVRLNQMGCVYSPHVVGVQVGQVLRIINSDPTLHNVHSVSTANKAFNFGMAVQGQESLRYFHAPEIMVKLKCDVHPWMSAYIGVVSNPYFAVTGEDGTFTLDGIPAGRYTVEAWHESLGALRREVTLTQEGSTEIHFEYPES